VSYRGHLTCPRCGTVYSVHKWTLPFSTWLCYVLVGGRRCFTFNVVKDAERTALWPAGNTCGGESG
jgi:hypothetical protein